jgi:hypoxanthine phosphoribosyltransferase
MVTMHPIYNYTLYVILVMFNARNTRASSFHPECLIAMAFGGVHVAQYIDLCVAFRCRQLFCLFAPFRLAIVLSYFHRFYSLKLHL